MGKKSRKTRFNQIVDIDIKYANTSVDYDQDSSVSKLNLTKEKMSELQRLRSQLPTAPHSVRLEEEVFRLPESGPFRLYLANVATAAVDEDIYSFFDPLRVVKIIKEELRQRGLCSVDFSTRKDLASAIEKDGTYLLSRRVNFYINKPTQVELDSRSFGVGRRSYQNDSKDGFGQRRRFDDNRYSSSGGQTNMNEDVGWRRGSTIHSGRIEEVKVQPDEMPQRPVIKLLSRTKPLDNNDTEIRSQRYASIFGDAKPVDTASKDIEIESRNLSIDQTDIRTPYSGESRFSNQPVVSSDSLSATRDSDVQPNIKKSFYTAPQTIPNPTANVWTKRKEAAAAAAKITGVDGVRGEDTQSSPVPEFSERCTIGAVPRQASAWNQPWANK